LYSRCSCDPETRSSNGTALDAPEHVIADAPSKPWSKILLREKVLEIVNIKMSPTEIQEAWEGHFSLSAECFDIVRPHVVVHSAFVGRHVVPRSHLLIDGPRVVASMAWICVWLLTKRCGPNLDLV